MNDVLKDKIKRGIVWTIAFFAIYILAGILAKAVFADTYLVSPDGTYLGNLNNKYDTNSIYNKYGRYGSKYSPDSINNSYGKYGSKYSPYSPNNPYATQAPLLINRGYTRY
jgi:hypothetical protein